MSRVSQFPAAKIKHHNFTSSDHCIISLDYLSLVQSKAPPFRFEKMWCSCKAYDILVKKTWCQRFSGSYMFCLVKKCKLLKAKSKEWNKTQFGNIFRQLRLVDSKLMAVQAALVVNQDDISSQQKQEILLNKRSKLLSYSHDYWKQKVSQIF